MENDNDINSNAYMFLCLTNVSEYKLTLVMSAFENLFCHSKTVDPFITWIVQFSFRDVSIE